MFQGAEGFTDKSKARLKHVYNMLKDTERSDISKAQGITLLDIYLVAMVCNRFYNQPPAKNSTAQHRFIKATELLTERVDELKGVGDRLVENLRNWEGTHHASEELLNQACSVMLKILFLTTENMWSILEVLPGQNIVSALEHSLDKAWVQKNHKYINKGEK